MSEKANLSTKYEVLSVKLKLGKRLKDDYGENDRRMINLNGFIFAFKPNGSMVSDLQLKCWWMVWKIVTEQMGVFTNSLQYKNANIANFSLAVSLEMNEINEVCNLEI